MFTEAPVTARATCTRLPGIDMSLPFVMHGMVALLPSDGRTLLLGVPYSTTGQSHLCVITLPGGEIARFPLHDDGAYAVVAGPDGCAYLGTLGGHLLRFDPQRWTLEDLGQPLPGEEFRGGFCCAAGYCYFGTSPGGAIIEYDPRTGRITPVQCPPTDDIAHCVHAFVDLPDGRVAAFINGRRIVAALITPGTGTVAYVELPELADASFVRHAVLLDAAHAVIGTWPSERLFQVALDSPRVLGELPRLPREDGLYCLQRVGDAVLAAGAASGALYRWTGEEWELRGAPMPYDPLLFTALSDGRLAGITRHGRLVQSTIDWRMYALSPVPTRTRDGMQIGAVGMGPDHRLYFAPTASMRIGRWDPDTDELTELFVAAPHPGEVSAFGIAGERLYLAFGAPGGVMCYYPDLPYRLLANPTQTDLLSAGYSQPLSPMVSYHGRLYFATRTLYGPVTSALARVEPQVGRLTTFTDIIPGQQLTGVAVDRQNGLLVVGGSCAGGAARVACWSPDTERTVRTAIPFARADTVRVWAAEGGRAFLTDDRERLAILTVATGEVHDAGIFPLGAITSLITTQHGELYGLAGGWLFRLDAEHGRIERLAEATGHHLTEVRRGLFAYAHDSRLHTVQLW